MSDQETPRIINFDFSTVFPKAVVARFWNQPYDRDWIGLNIATRKQLAFNRAGTSKLKLVDLMRGGVLEVGDTFEVGVIRAGRTIYRFPVVRISALPCRWESANLSSSIQLVGRVLSGRNVGCPIIRMLPLLHTDPPFADYIVKGPVEIVRYTLSHYGYQEAAIDPRRKGWHSVVVWDGPDELDSLHDLRQAYALWRGIVDWYTTTHDLEGRRRRIDRRTGDLHSSKPNDMMPPNLVAEGGFLSIE
ncbi:MAG: hypothetical protein Q9208_001386 [Pyrenodesmia sp. 3 TL-2023]